jgi:hypothetical protein
MDTLHVGPCAFLRIYRTCSLSINWIETCFTQKLRKKLSKYFMPNICLGGLVVSVLATGPKVAGSIPAEIDGFLRVIKIRSTISFGGEVCPMS